MSTKDAKLSYAILAIATVAVLALVAIYAGRSGDTMFTENAIRKGTLPAGARSAPPAAKGVQAAQSMRATGHAASQASLSRTTKVQRHSETQTPHGGEGPALTRSATTSAAGTAKSAGSQSTISRTRSAGTQMAQAANPAARSASASDGVRSASRPSAQAAKPSAGAKTSPSLARAASAQAAQAAKPDGAAPSAQSQARSATAQAAQAARPDGAAQSTQGQSRSATAQAAQGTQSGRAGDRTGGGDAARTAPLQAARAAAQPTASQAFGRTLVRSAAAQTAHAARTADHAAGHPLTRSAPDQAAQAAPADRDMGAPNRTTASEMGRAAQAPLALRRKWDPARSMAPSPEQDLPETEDIQEL